MQQIGRKREAFLDRKPGACPRRARDRRVGPPGAQCLWICTPVIDPFSWEWSVGEKTEGYSTKQLKGRANECHSGGTEDTTRHASRAALPNTKTATSLRHRTVIGAELRKHGCRGHSQPRGVPNRAWLSHSFILWRSHLWPLVDRAVACAARRCVVTLLVTATSFLVSLSLLRPKLSYTSS